MKKMDVSSGNVIKKTITEIRKIAPWSQNIEIKLIEEPKGHFNTTISLKSKRKNLIAQKEEDSPIKSLSKTRKALLRQIEKIHRKKRRIIFRESDLI